MDTEKHHCNYYFSSYCEGGKINRYDLFPCLQISWVFCGFYVLHLKWKWRNLRTFFLKQYDIDDGPREEVTYRQLKSEERKPELLNGHIPAGHIPKPIVMPDYLA